MWILKRIKRVATSELIHLGLYSVEWESHTLYESFELTWFPIVYKRWTKRPHPAAETPTAPKGSCCTADNSAVWADILRDMQSHL